MADSRWVSTTGDLSAAASYSPSGVPSTGRMNFDDGSQYDVVSGLTAFAASNFTKVWFHSTYQGNVGADGNALELSPQTLIHQGSGSLFFKPVTNAITLSNILIDSTNQQDALTVLIGGDSSSYNLYIRSGAAQLLNGTGAWRRLHIGAHFGVGPFLTIGSSVGVISDYYQTSGFVTTQSPLGKSGQSRCTIDGGDLTYDQRATSAWNHILLTGGTFHYNGTGTLSEAIIESGTLDMQMDGRAKTISTVIIHPGANFLTHDAITVTNLIDLRLNVPTFPS